MWLTPHPRDLIQPEGEREREFKTLNGLLYADVPLRNYPLILLVLLIMLLTVLVSYDML